MGAHFAERLLVRFLLVGFFVTLSVEGFSQNAKPSWPRFLGADGESVSSASLPTSWDESNYLWATEIPGSGWSSPGAVEDTHKPDTAAARLSPTVHLVGLQSDWRFSRPGRSAFSIQYIIEGI